MTNLYPKRKFQYPITAQCINPDIFQGKSRKEIIGLDVWEGNKLRNLGELFKIEETGENDQEETFIAIHGDLTKVRRIGAEMSQGVIKIHGDVGMHLGEEMQDGRIVVNGNVCGWAGSMMKGGTIEINGDAGNYLGAPYRGSRQGMRGGKIIVHGNVGDEPGAYMKKGLIKIYGNSGQFTGLGMLKGTIYVQKNCGGRVGACMTRGKIVVSGSLESLLPTFTIDRLKNKAKIEEKEVVEGPFYVFLGDITEDGQGKVYVCKEKNPHLNPYERFL